MRNIFSRIKAVRCLSVDGGRVTVGDREVMVWDSVYECTRYDTGKYFVTPYIEEALRFLEEVQLCQQ